jgi:hypothetical protein
MRMFARLTKVDEARRTVIGRAIQEVVDKTDEVFDYASSKPLFAEWSKSFAEATDGQSLGNLRAMHGKVAAGKLTGLDFNDTDKAIDISAKVVDEAEWAKVLEGVYTGFSIGGQYVGERITEKAIDGREVRRYTAKPTEISLVDNPCVPTAQFFDILKADGSTLQKAFAPPALEVQGSDDDVRALAELLQTAGKSLPEALDVLKREFSQKERDDAADSGAALPDGSFPIENKSDLKNAIQAYGRAKDKEKAKAHIIARAKALGATDELPDDWKEKASTDELHEAFEAAVLSMDLTKRAKDAGTIGDLLAVAAGVLTEQERNAAKSTDDLRAAVIAKARMTQAHMDKIQAVHDHAADMGASCRDSDGDGKAAPAPVKKDDEPNAELTTLKAELAKAQERLAKLEAQPMPHVVTLRTINKAQDRSTSAAAPGPVESVDVNTVDLTPDDYLLDPITKQVDYYASRVNKVARLRAAR